MGLTKSAKRKSPFSSGLQRRVRARKEESEPEEILSESAEGSSEKEEEDCSDSDDVSQFAEDASEGDTKPSLDPTQISFGMLAKVQSMIPQKKRRHQPSDDSDSDSDSDDAPSEVGGPRKPKPVAGRTNKHAPAEQSSKRQVSRKREVVPVQKRQSRDPRFGPLGGGGGARPPTEDAVRKNYAFLSSYRDSEMATLRVTIKKTKDPAAKEELQRALMSMQSKKQAQQRKDDEKRVLEEHRRQEKELVKQGKTPFYLKKSEQKKQVLMERFAGMKKRQVDKAIERKRKKITSKERKEMPMERRAR